jgi:hypothetical protein
MLFCIPKLIITISYCEVKVNIALITYFYIIIILRHI